MFYSTELVVNARRNAREFPWAAGMAQPIIENQIRSLTPEQIVTAMRKHLDPAKITIIKAGDFARSASR